MPRTRTRRSRRAHAGLLVVVALVLVCCVPGCAPRRGAATVPAPSAGAEPFERGIASWYGRKFHGRRTASGERYDMHALTAAHRTLPFGTRVLVRNLGNGRSVVVRINDRGPFVRGRVIDVSRAAAQRLDMVDTGLARVALYRAD